MIEYSALDRAGNFSELVTLIMPRGMVARSGIDVLPALMRGAVPARVVAALIGVVFMRLIRFCRVCLRKQREEA